ncbi:MAG: class I SAM-dependent methyltransferase [Chloroflexi bacterium]|nr:class I SAM-dependent methyltransferase [Chloroflexota bacterium]
MADLTARRLALGRLAKLRTGRLRVILPGGSERTFGPRTSELAATVRVHDEGVFRRLLFEGEAGFAEAYVDGAWETDDLVALLALGARARQQLRFNEATTALLSRLEARRQSRSRAPGTARASKENVVAHYDHGNDFYGLWLDESMSYSCAVFAGPAQSLEAAQENKLRLMAEKAGIRDGDRVLDIGCGWGAFARYAARHYGCKVTGITLSPNQLALARERTAAEGLDDRVSFELADYREFRGSFDRIVSIGMFEHVGADYWETFFRACRRLLAPGGRMALQSITLPDRALAAHLASSGWIQRHIFPGAALPSLAAIERAASRGGFLLVHAEDIGPHYATTLHHWRARFLGELEAVRALGYDDQFIRRWDYYLALSEAGFLTRTTCDMQVVFEPAPE